MRFCSAMPRLKKRSGYFAPNVADFKEAVVSAPRTTTLGFVPPTSASASPKASRIDPSFSSITSPPSRSAPSP